MTALFSFAFAVYIIVFMKTTITMSRSSRSYLDVPVGPESRLDVGDIDSTKKLEKICPVTFIGVVQTR